MMRLAAMLPAVPRRISRRHGAVFLKLEVMTASVFSRTTHPSSVSVSSHPSLAYFGKGRLGREIRLERVCHFPIRKGFRFFANSRWDTNGRLIDLFEPQECANYFAAAECGPD